MKPDLLASMVLATALAGAIAFSPLAASCASSQEPHEGDPVSIGTFRQLHSDVLNEDRLLLVSLPPDYEDGATSYPLLFVLYGDQIRGYFADAVHVVDRLSEAGSIPKMIIVGVANVERYRDLSPVERRGDASGIEPFSRFVVEELIPFVESEYRVKDYRVLVGPQAGAEFAMYSLAKRPGVFNAFIIENPFRSEPVHDLLLAAMIERICEGIPSSTFLQITCADRAGDLDKTEDMEYMRCFEKTIADKSPRNLALEVHYVEKSGDFLPPLRLKEGLRSLFHEYRFPDGMEVKGLSDITAYYSSLSGRLGFDVDVPESTLYFKADELSKNGSPDSALEVLEYLIDVYPTSVNGHWGLANLHRELGNRKRALECYYKCLDMMPNMPPARHWIEKLEGQE